jgi:uncharacterized protein YuzE
VKLDYDPASGAAYLYLKKIGSGEAAAQEERLGGSLIIDFDTRGRILGFEFPFNALGGMSP